LTVVDSKMSVSAAINRESRTGDFSAASTKFLIVAGHTEML
jgi:hypothetical protein